MLRCPPVAAAGGFDVSMNVVARRRASGYILIYVLVLSLVMGALVFAYQESFRQRNVQVRLNTDRVSARFLARAAIDALRWAFREAPDPSRLAGTLDLESGPILPFLLADTPALEKRVARKTAGAPDHRALVEQLLGADALSGLDRMVAEVPGAQVQVFAELAPTAPLPGPLRDAAQKSIALTLRAVARVRRASEAYAFTETLTVYSQLPVAAKFTLAGVNVGSVNTARITSDGKPGEGPAPLVLFHSPADCDVLAATPFEGTPGSEKPLVEKPVPPRDVVRAHADRGLVYLDSSESDRAVRLNVGAGGTPYGEMHSVYRNESGKLFNPQPEGIPDPPGKFSSFAPENPTSPGMKQAAELEGAALGFHKDTNAQGALRPLPAAPTGNPTGPGYEDTGSTDAPVFTGDAPPPDFDPTQVQPGFDPSQPAPEPAAPEPAGAAAPVAGLAASRILLYGTGTFPSPTAVLGNVQRVVAWISNVGIDRDAGPDDENAQSTAAGRKVPLADAHEPVLVNCDEVTFRADLAGESSAVVNYRRLRSFGDNGQVTNVNALYDADNDGVPEAPVAGEEPTFALDLTQWKYGNLFDDYKQYQTVMSRELAFPANLSLHLPALSPQQSAELLRNLALARPTAVPPDDFQAAEARVEHRGRLHQLLGNGNDQRTWLDLKDAPPDALRTALTGSVARRHPGDEAVVVRGQRELERLFFTGTALDLKGLRVKVVTETGRGVATVSFPGALNVRPGSGGVLEVERFEAGAILNPGQGEGFAPFVLRARELVLSGKGPYEALVATSQVRQEDIRTYAVIRGALFLEEPVLDLRFPLVVSYDPRLDPTGPEAALHYRVAYQPGPRGYDLLERP